MLKFARDTVMLNVSRSVTAFPRLVEQINVGVFPLSDFSKTTSCDLCELNFELMIYVGTYLINIIFDFK